MTLKPQHVQQHTRQYGNSRCNQGIQHSHFPAEGGPHQTYDDRVEQRRDKQEGQGRPKTGFGRQEPTQHGDG